MKYLLQFIYVVLLTIFIVPFRVILPIIWYFKLESLRFCQKDPDYIMSYGLYYKEFGYGRNSSDIYYKSYFHYIWGIHHKYNTCPFNFKFTKNEN